MEQETLELPIISYSSKNNKRDIQGSEIILSPTTEANLPDPIQPSISYMEASLPTQLCSLTISKLIDYTATDPRLRQVLPPPLPLRQASICSSSSSSSYDGDSEETDRRDYTLIPLLLNPIEEDNVTQNTSQSSKQYNCSFCRKNFIRPSSLKIHTYSHTGEKPFSCSFPGCRRRFSVHSNMRRHLRVHSD